MNLRVILGVVFALENITKVPKLCSMNAIFQFLFTLNRVIS